MSASRNEATGDVLANVKGSSDAFSDGMDYMKNPIKDWVHDYGNPRILATQDEVDEVNNLRIPHGMKVTYRIGDSCPWRKVV